MDENSQVNSGRIDLSRFSGMTEGKWEVIDTPNGGIDVGVRHGANSHSPVITFTQRLADMVRKSTKDMADLSAIAMLPELIDELKKSYTMIDEAQEYVRHLTATPDILTQLLGEHPTTDNLRMSLEGLLTLLGADERSGYGSHSTDSEQRG